MAEIRITRRTPELSAFQRSASTGNSDSLLTLAATMRQAYDMLAPVAAQQQTEQANADWTAYARGAVGNPGSLSVSSSGGSSFRSALRQAESGGRVDVVNSEGFTGLYQWGQPRLDDYNRATGQNVTMEQFRGSAQIQEAAQDWHESDILGQLGGYVGTTVNGQVLDEGAIIGMAHLGGVGGARQYIETGGAYNPADSNGTRLSDYAGRFGGLPVGGGVTVSTQSAPVVVQTADGRLQPRLYSPASGEILQAYNAAAQVAYRNETELKAAEAISSLSNQFLLDPTGFRQAAQGYIDQVTKDAPDMFRAEIRGMLDQQVQRRFLGILEDQQADIRQRASNSNMALIERHQNTLADALVAGNPDAIAAAEADLRGQLAVRETLPGLSWTPEQSENAILDARDKAARVQEQNQRIAQAETGETLRTIMSAAAAGEVSALDAKLQDPAFRALADPDLLADADMAVMVREAAPGFTSSTPEQQAAFIADLRADGVTDPRDVKAIQAFERMQAATAEAFRKDPVAAARAFLPEKPPELPDMMDPGYSAALAARLAYAKGLQAQGFTPYVALFDAEERVQSGAVFGKDIPPEVKLAAAEAVVAALGDDAAMFFQQTKTDDKVSLYVGQMIAGGGDRAVGLEAMRGQQLMDMGQASKPKLPSVAAVSTDVATALTGLPVPPELTDTARAIYVARNPDLDPTSADGKTKMEEALQAALGQTVDPLSQQKVGGVQTVLGAPTLLPPDVSGERMEAVLTYAVTGKMPPPTWARNMPFGFMLAETPKMPPDQVWRAAGALGVPSKGGKPISEDMMKHVVVVPVTPDLFQMFLEVQGQRVPVYPGGMDQKPFLFNPAALVKAAR